MIDNILIKKLEKVEKIAITSKFKRMMVNPFKYLNAIFFREVVYKRKKIEKEVICNTFFDTKMHLLLPSSTDIYLTGGKSHYSEIRLAKFLINNLAKGDVFVDVGAHYGYFSLLGSRIVEKKGKVYSFEASPSTYRVLSKNTQQKGNIKSYNLAVSDKEAKLKFYEFPNLYSEYNTLEIEQFKSEKWFAEFKPKEINVNSVILAKFLKNEKVYPKIIKIDVEGAELSVINGLSNYLSDFSPLIIMEYLSYKRGNKEHQEAEKKLNSLGYFSFLIDNLGNLQKQESISKYLEQHNLESDNIVFMKRVNIS